jgi:AmiR/NasT family two-component response regulator
VVSNWRIVDAEVAFIDALARSEANNRELAAQLQDALDSRVRIEQAKGMVAAQRSISPEAAFEVIRDHGRRHGRKLHDVAHDIIELGLRP